MLPQRSLRYFARDLQSLKRYAASSLNSIKEGRSVVLRLGFKRAKQALTECVDFFPIIQASTRLQASLAKVCGSVNFDANLKV